MPKDFTITQATNKGYQNRLDNTILEPGILIAGSKNVITKTTGRVGVVQGYELDGPNSTTLAGIQSKFDYEMSNGSFRNLRAYTDQTSSKGILQYRYVDSAGSVTWRNLGILFNRGLIRFTDWWDNTEKKTVVLFVDGTTNVFEWNGAITTYASSTVNTITKEGTTTWGAESFNSVANKKIMINGVEYTYTGGEGTTTLTGVTPDPTGAGLTAGMPIHQSYVTTASITSATGVNFDYISTLVQQAYYGSNTSRVIYISKLNNYKDCGFTSPVRVTGEGALLTLDGTPKGFQPQESLMYVTAGQGYWYNVKFTKSADLSKEVVDIERLKTGAKQAAKSQELIGKDKNNIMFVSNEPVMTSLGRVANNLATPASQDLSFPIVNDFNSYDFTDGSVSYYKNFIIVTVPKSGIIRIYNQTLADNQYWEAPIEYPISFTYIVDGELYGHSYNTPESYKLLTGYNFIGQPIPAVANFSYQNYGTRTTTKGFNQFYIEGYISQNGTLYQGVTYEIDGNAQPMENEIVGDDAQIVALYSASAGLGKKSLGKNPLGSQTEQIPALAPKFRVIKTFPPTYFYEHLTSFKSTAIDFQWELICFGPRLIESSDLNTNIKQ